MAPLALLFPEVLQEACPRSSSPRKCFTRPISPGFTHCVAGRFMPFGARPACSWTRFPT